MNTKFIKNMKQMYEIQNKMTGKRFPSNCFIQKNGSSIKNKTKK